MAMGDDIGIKEILLGLLLVALFIVALFNFGTILKTNNNDSSDFIDTDKLDLASYETEINDTTEGSIDWQTLFASDNIFVATGTLALFSLWGIFNLVQSAIINFLNLIFDGLYQVLGIDPMVIGVIASVIIIMIIFSIWRILKKGD